MLALDEWLRENEGAGDEVVGKEEVRKERQDKIRELLERWRVLNLNRGIALGVAALVASLAVFRRGKWVEKAATARSGWRRR